MDLCLVGRYGELSLPPPDPPDHPHPTPLFSFFFYFLFKVLEGKQGAIFFLSVRASGQLSACSPCVCVCFFKHGSVPCRTLRCASIPKVTGSNPSSGNELTFRSDLLWTARGGST
jgi:hypothetical protein